MPPNPETKPDLVSTTFARIRAHPVLGWLIVLGVVLIGAAKAGVAIDELQSLWVKWKASATPTTVAKATAGSSPLRTTWKGQWKKPDGFGYDFAMHLEIAASDSVNGYILWRLLKAPAGSGMENLINQPGTEFVRGIINRTTGTVSVAGYRVDNPDLLGLDKYQFSIFADGRRFRGMTLTNDGDWGAAMDGELTAVEESE